MILQSNPLAGYLAYREEFDKAVTRVLHSGHYILGKEVKSFELEFAQWLGVDYSVGVANGTDAIELALRAMGVGQGDCVATVSHTAAATVAAIRRVGAIPVFVDIEEAYFTMDPESLEELISGGAIIKAIVVVHLYGQMADMSAIRKVAGAYGIPLIEDCAQAHGATLHGRKAGNWGEAASFSFYPTKNLGGFGDGGAVVTNDSELADKLQSLRQYGWDESRVCRFEGVNSRLDELQAAILRVRLSHLDKLNQLRCRIASQYSSGFQSAPGIGLPAVREGAKHVYHQFVVCCRDRGAIQERLQSRGIGSAIHYSIPAHRHPAYQNPKQAPVSLDVTERLADQILSLPMYPELDPVSVERVCETVVEATES